MGARDYRWYLHWVMRIIITIILLLFTQLTNAQTAVSAAGSSMTLNSGSISLTIGQVFYQCTGSTQKTQGVQQVYLYSQKEIIDNEVYIPTAFTPNGDGLNDVFEPIGYKISTYTLSIFNTWGENIYRGSQPWSINTTITNGVYTYNLQVVFKNGSKQTYNGVVTLLK